MVVLGGGDRPVRRRQQRERRQHDEGDASETRSAAGRHELDPAEQHRQHRGERGRAVDVPPDDEKREHEVHATARASSFRRQQPHQTGEERQCEDLGTDREGPGSRHEHWEEHEQDRARPATQLPSCDGGDRERADCECGDDDREQPVASEHVRPVSDELRAPLLVGPRPTLAEDRELVATRQAVLGDLASRDERQPGVRDQQSRREDGEEDDAERRVEDDEEELLPGDAPDPGQRPTRPSRWGSRPDRVDRRGGSPRCGS